MNMNMNMNMNIIYYPILIAQNRHFSSSVHSSNFNRIKYYFSVKFDCCTYVQCTYIFDYNIFEKRNGEGEGAMDFDEIFFLAKFVFRIS